jgi:polyketide cyclase/dehydrase/lipid transport protein
MIMLPDPAVYTTAPLRNRIRLELTAPVGEVWGLVGDHRRLPEYSAGIESVDVATDEGARTCRFRATDATPSMDLTERIRWYIPRVGYSASATEPNPFQLTNDLSIVTVGPADGGTVFEWAQYFDSPDLPAAVQSFDQGLVDIAERLIARFGGDLKVHWAQALPESS